MKKFRILLDLDCVLADFVSGAVAAHGLNQADVYRVWEPGTYGMGPPLGTAKGLGRPLTEEEFWAPLSGGNGFWEWLPELPWATELAVRVKAATDDWWVVTSPSRCDHCIPEKRRWLNRFFGVPYFDRMIPHGTKHLLANPSTILIDDYEHNIDAFRKAGGISILFPAHHNRMWGTKNDPMSHVRETLDVMITQ